MKMTNRYHVLTADSLVQNAINLKIIRYLKNLFFFGRNKTIGKSKMLSLSIVAGLRIAINCHCWISAVDEKSQQRVFFKVATLGVLKTALVMALALPSITYFTVGPWDPDIQSR